MPKRPRSIGAIVERLQAKEDRELHRRRVRARKAFNRYVNSMDHADLTRIEPVLELIVGCITYRGLK